MREFLNNEIFIERSIKLYGNRYDYSLVDYKTSKTKVKIICPEHGEFEQIPSSHLRGINCKKCGLINASKSRTYNTEEFIEKAICVHVDKYDYSLVDYKNTEKRVKIICSEHGEFEQKPHTHLGGSGCQKCGTELTIKGESSNTEEFIEKSRKIYENKYDYSLVNYCGNKTKVRIICPKHGEFEQIPNSHLMGNGCFKCGIEKSTESKISNSENFTEKAIKLHGDKYDYSLVNYELGKEKVKIVCSEHGEFKQTPNSHLSGNGCPTCKESKGEKKIRKFLEKNNIKFQIQKKFNNCKNIRKLPFDFYLPKQNLLIEYDGALHFKAVNYFGGEEGFKYRQDYDKIKNKFAKDNKINLIRIPYTECDNIIFYLKKILL